MCEEGIKSSGSRAGVFLLFITVFSYFFNLSLNSHILLG